MLKNLLTTICLFTVTLFTVYAQSSSKSTKNYTHSVGMLVSRGFILNGSAEIAHMTQTHPTGLELYWHLNTYGNKEWETFFNYPEVGFAINYQELHNSKIGQAISFVGFINFYFLRHKSLEVYYHGAFGTTLITRPYNREKNNKNNLITTYFNYTLQPRIGIKYKLDPMTKLTASLAINHASNGAFRKPNKGLNIVAAEFGVVRKLQRRAPAFKNHIVGPPEIYPLRYNVIFAFGVKELNPTGGKKYPVYTLQTYVDLRVQPFRSVLFGFDFFDNLGAKEEIRRNFQNSPKPLPDYRQIAVMAGQEVFFDRVSFLMQIGVYIYKPYKESDKPLYQRIALKYNWKYKYSAHVALKTHYGSADSVEWGLGYRF